MAKSFKDRQWIEMDSDLEALRGEQEYKEMLADDKLFEKEDE